MVRDMLQILVLALITLFAPTSAMAASAQQVTLPDGRTISYRCAGKGGPTTILEAGWSADSRAWGRIINQLSRGGQACAFDRAGAGQSSSGPLPRSPYNIAKDIHSAATILKLKPPYLLVGHSAGGLYMLRFAQLFPKDTGALLLVDPTPRNANLPQPLIERSRKCLAVARGQTVSDPQPSCADHPAPRAATIWAMRLSELESLKLADQNKPQVPGRVLSAIKGRTPEYMNFMLHAQGSLIGVRAEPIDSGHMMMFERPEVIVAAAQDLRRKIR